MEPFEERVIPLKRHFLVLKDQHGKVQASMRIQFPLGTVMTIDSPEVDKGHNWKLAAKRAFDTVFTIRCYETSTHVLEGDWNEAVVKCITNPNTEVELKAV